MNLINIDTDINDMKQHTVANIGFSFGEDSISNTLKRKRLDGDAYSDDLKRLLQIKSEERMIFKRIGLTINPEYSKVSNILFSETLENWIQKRRQSALIMQTPDILRNIFDFLGVLTPVSHEMMISTLKFGKVCQIWKDFIHLNITSVFIPYHDEIGFNMNDFLLNVGVKSIQTVICNNPVVFVLLLAKLKELGRPVECFNPIRIILATEQLFNWRRSKYQSYSWKKVLVRDFKMLSIPDKFKNAIRSKETFTMLEHYSPQPETRGFRNTIWPIMNNVVYTKSRKIFY